MSTSKILAFIPFINHIYIDPSSFDSANVQRGFRTSYYIKIGKLVFYYVSCEMKNGNNSDYVSVFTFPDNYRPNYGNANSFGSYYDDIAGENYTWGVSNDGTLKVRNKNSYYVTMNGWFMRV